MDKKILFKSEAVFKNEKRNILKKMISHDKSKKGSLDEEIRELVLIINSLDDYYTTSSCAGRIMLIKIDEKRRKDKSEWVYVTHGKASFEDVKEAMLRAVEKLNEGESIWFKQEPLILHVCAKNLESANKILSLARDSGLKKSGIITLSHRIIIEIEGTENISTLVAKNYKREKKILIGDDYFKILVKEANHNMLINDEKNKRFLEKIREYFR